MNSMFNNVDKLNTFLPFDQVVHVINIEIELFPIIARATKYFYSSFQYNSGNLII